MRKTQMTKTNTKTTLKTEPTTIVEKQILIDARKRALICLENCLAKSYTLSLASAENMWKEAKALSAEIRALEAEQEATQKQSKTTKGN